MSVCDLCNIKNLSTAHQLSCGSHSQIVKEKNDELKLFTASILSVENMNIEKVFITNDNKKKKIKISPIISVDIRNAFNSVDRIQMLKAVKQFPDLLLFFWSYSTPSDLFFDNHCLSSSQGDPLGPFLYSLTTLPILSWLNSLSGVSSNVLPKGAQKKLTRIFFSDRAETFTSSLPSNLLSVHNACQLPLSSRFLSLNASCLTDLTLQDSSLRWICCHHLLFNQDIVSFQLKNSVDAGPSSNCNNCSRHRTFRSRISLLNTFLWCLIHFQTLSEPILREMVFSCLVFYINSQVSVFHISMIKLAFIILKRTKYYRWQNSSLSTLVNVSSLNNN
ncbi:hypothetical protein GEMRC1_013086 [Eukaryota sp. GEM-RC1]